MTTPYSDSVSATADGLGKAVFNFRSAQARHVIQCAVTVDGAASTATSQATVGIAGGVGRPWGSWTGANASQGLQFVAPEILSVVTTGLTPGAGYTAFLEGVDYDTQTDFVPYMSPSQPYSTAVTVAGGALNFQHNDVLVAAEPAIDFEDGSGALWTLTDDPTANRVKVALSSVGALLARTQYAPVGNVTYGVLGGGSLAALDTTNLSVSFVVPASGDVIVRAFGGLAVATGGAGRDLFSALFDHGTTNQIGFTQLCASTSSNDAAVGFYLLEQLITGLTPGATVHYDLAAAARVNSITLNVQGATGVPPSGTPIIIEVWSA